MMKSNKAMAKQMLNNRPGMPPMDDAQLDMILSMMTPEMMRMSARMASQNPELLRQNLGNRPNVVPTATTTTRRSEEEAKGPAAGMPPMAEMMNNPMVQEMMNNPEMMKAAMDMMQGQQGQPTAEALKANPTLMGMLKNPEMIKASINMMKSNPAMLEMVSKQMPGVDPQSMLTALDYLSRMADWYVSAANLFRHKLV